MDDKKYWTIQYDMESKESKNDIQWDIYPDAALFCRTCINFHLYTIKNSTPTVHYNQSIQLIMIKLGVFIWNRGTYI